MKHLRSLFAMVLFICGYSASASVSMAPTTDEADLSATFSVDAPTNVPGKTLKAGTYSIHVLDHLSDRVILQIQDSKGKAETSFLAVPNATLPHGSGVGPIPYAEAKHKAGTLRGFAFPGGNAVEFVYPKEQAAGIAKTSGANVLAIDPASEGRPALAKLSKDDMELVTLWTLSPTRVGPENASQPAIQAQRYQPVQPPAPVQIASLNDGPRLSAPQNAAAPARASAMTAQPAPTQRPARPVKRPAVIASLPHTASQLPLIFLSGLFLLGRAFVFRFFKVQIGAR